MTKSMGKSALLAVMALALVASAGHAAEPVGFLLAGDRGEEMEGRHPTAAKAKNQIKGAIMGGVSAAISQQLRSFIEEQGGIGALLSAIGVPLPGDRNEPYFMPDEDLQDV